jgi:bifunctional DNA-binding transcriptional regulator/antitoxin component of YhaV-PrlF toxin-antitoxin module
MATETIVTSKGASPIPPKIRRKAGISPRTVLSWTLRGDGVITVCKQAATLNAAQRHIRARSGTWDGRISGAELLRRTRP